MTDFQKNVLFKKNIVLIPADYDGISNQKGVLSLEFLDNKVLGTIRCYNLKTTDEVYNIGVQVGDNTFKTTATAKELSNLKIEMNSNANNGCKISCVIIKLNEKNYTTLLWGSTETTRALEKSFYVEDLLYKTQIIEKQQVKKEMQFFEKNVLPNSIINSYDDNQIKEAILSKQEEIFEDEMLENYIDKVMAQTEDDASNFDEKKDFQKHNQTNVFYEKISKQVDKMFEQNEPDLVLQQMIPNSKFCKVLSGEDYYVFGVINENGSAKCLCYGIPSEFSNVPPQEVEGYCQWLPINANDYKGNGYWMTYQDAMTGENISVEIVS